MTLPTKPCACGKPGCVIVHRPNRGMWDFERRKYATRACVQMRGGEPAFIAAELEIVRRRLEEGATFAAIGAELDRHPSGVCKVAKRNGWRSVREPHGAWQRTGAAA
jgi:hypothetical protein